MATEFPISANTNPAVKDIDKLIVALRKAGKEAGMTEKEIDDLANSTKKAGTEGVNHVNKMNQSFNGFVKDGIKKVGAAIAAAFAVQQLIAFGKQIVNITAEFQKFEAVLINTLGSKSAAYIAMAQIKDFAAKTPFSVQELTASFVKLANQGFKPTVEEMRKLGDLAAANGKTFDMLTEAIIDGQTGEFERLKEFGIRASKEGDRVTFTFKGVKTQTDFTAQSIREYILSLGDAAGVSGGMAAISETLGGKISNLGDAWDSFMETLGDQGSGPLSNAIKNLSILLEYAKEYVMTQEQRDKLEQREGQAKAVENLKARAMLYGDLQQASDDYVKMLENQIKVEEAYRKTLKFSENDDAAINAFVQRKAILKAQIEAIKDYTKSEIDRQTAEGGGVTKSLGLIEQLELQLKQFKEAKQTAFSEQEITFFNRKIEETEKRLKQLNNLGGENLFLQLDEKVLTDWAKSLEKNIAEAAEDAFKRGERAMKKFSEAFEEDAKEREEAERQRIEELNEAKQFARDIEMDAINSIFDARSQAIENEMDMLERQRARELELAGDNKEAQAKINQKFDEKQRGLINKQNQMQQNQALFNMGVSLGPSIAKTVEKLGFPLAIPFIAAVGILFASLFAKQRSIAVPKYATGVFDLEGPGTGTSDSIDARLSRGESVADAETTNKFGDILKPMIENEFFSYADIKRIVDQKIPSQVTAVIIPAASGADNPELLKEVRATRKAIKNLKQVHVTVDRDGIRVQAQQGLQWTEYVNNRYSV